MRPTKATKGFDLSHDRPQLSMHDRPHCTQPFFTVIWNWPFHLPNISHIFNLFYKNKTTNSSTSGQNSFALKRIINSKLQKLSDNIIFESNLFERQQYHSGVSTYFTILNTFRVQNCAKNQLFFRKRKKARTGKSCSFKFSYIHLSTFVSSQQFSNSTLFRTLLKTPR